MEEKKVFNTEQAAEYLGLNPDVLRRYARQGLIPVRKVGRKWLFHKDHLVEWLRGNREENK